MWKLASYVFAKKSRFIPIISLLGIISLVDLMLLESLCLSRIIRLEGADPCVHARAMVASRTINLRGCMRRQEIYLSGSDSLTC